MQISILCGNMKRILFKSHIRINSTGGLGGVVSPQTNANLEDLSSKMPFLMSTNQIKKPLVFFRNLKLCEKLSYIYTFFKIYSLGKFHVYITWGAVSGRHFFFFC